MLSNVAVPAADSPAAISPAIEALTPDPGLGFESFALETVLAADGELADMTVATEELTTLLRLAEIGRTQGFTPGLMAYADPEALLATTVLGMPSVETLTEAILPSSPETQLAVEGLLDTIKEKLASWASKAWQAAQRIFERGKALVTTTIEKVGSFASWFKGKTMDAAKAAKATIKAHPYATAAVLAAAVAAVAVIVFTIWGGGLPALTLPAIQAWKAKGLAAVTNLKVPGFAIKVAENGKVLFTKVSETLATKSAAALGYTQANVTSLLDTLTAGLKQCGLKIGSALDVMRKGVEKGGLALIRGGDIVAKAGDTLIGVYAAGYRFLLALTWGIIREVLIYATAALMSGLGHLKSVFV